MERPVQTWINHNNEQCNSEQLQILRTIANFTYTQIESQIQIASTNLFTNHCECTRWSCLTVAVPFTRQHPFSRSNVFVRSIASDRAPFIAKNYRELIGSRFSRNQSQLQRDGWLAEKRDLLSKHLPYSASSRNFNELHQTKFISGVNLFLQRREWQSSV